MVIAQSQLITDQLQLNLNGHFYNAKLIDKIIKAIKRKTYIIEQNDNLLIIRGSRFLFTLRAEKPIILVTIKTIRTALTGKIITYQMHYTDPTTNDNVTRYMNRNARKLIIDNIITDHPTHTIKIIRKKD